MAKVSFTKLGLKKNEDIEIVEWNEQKIEVKQYLPIEDKLKLITAIIQNSIDDNGYYNPAKIYVYTIIEMINFDTNINFTEKQKTDVAKTYDLIVSSGFSAKVFEAINPYEYNGNNNLGLAWLRNSAIHNIITKDLTVEAHLNTSLLTF